MKLIDLTPFQNENGEIGILERIQGTLKYGFSWYPELEAQKSIISHLERGLSKGFVLVRNQTLGASGIVIPLALVGPPGIYVIHVTSLHGAYQAKGDSWGSIEGGRFQPDPINLLTRTERLARALKAFLERQGMELPVEVIPVILSANPGLHVESTRPIVRVVMSDALERWAASLSQGAPLLSVEAAYDIADHIANPRPPKPKEELQAKPQAPKQEPEEDDLYQPQANLYSEEDTQPPFNPSDLSFAFDDNEDRESEIPPNLIEPNPARPRPSQPEKRRIMGMTVPQVALLGSIVLVEICVLIAFAYLILSTS